MLYEYRDHGTFIRRCSVRIDGLHEGNPLGRMGQPPKPGTSGPVPSFKETMAKFLNDVNASQKVAGKAKEEFLAGKVTDVHQVMSKSGEAKVAFNMLVELRNKALDGYNELMRLRL
ncbi:MAG: flagellar hook-basal body complex protein FliE [Chitinivibrionales bacterium]|nr:flagellar hook-basal body complex protein FliE [Chitinivibrionales bacterium]